MSERNKRCIQRVCNIKNYSIFVFHTIQDVKQEGKNGFENKYKIFNIRRRRNTQE